MIGAILAISSHIDILTGSDSFNLKIPNISSTLTVYPFFSSAKFSAVVT